MIKINSRLSWCENFVERHSFHIVSGDLPFHKISTTGNQAKLRYFTLCINPFDVTDLF